ncbi:MAG TPA: hypothetical protein VHT03_08795 [Rhizomicrobium sp.]|jgi:hypothetical protein|nr:hypothetical protein [Rhizomicrobium sp.]
MSSLQILEGLIGTACAVACLYYARQGHLATEPAGSVQMAQPWHSTLGEYARKNPFAAAFGALALGFLISSWSMYVSPRAVVLASPRSVEKWHTVTRNVPTSDPAQAAKIAALQNSVNADAVTIAELRTDIDRLNRLLSKRAAARRAYGETARNAPPAVGVDTHPAAQDAAKPAGGAAPVPAPSNIAPGNGSPVGAANSAPPPNAGESNPPSAVPH